MYAIRSYYAAIGLAPILVTAMAGCAALVLARILTVDQVYRAIDWKVIFLLAGVIPLGLALQKTGAADLLGSGVTELLGPHGPWVVVSAFYLLSSLLTQVMSTTGMTS